MTRCSSIEDYYEEVMKFMIDEGIEVVEVIKLDGVIVSPEEAPVEFRRGNQVVA